MPCGGNDLGRLKLWILYSLAYHDLFSTVILVRGWWTNQDYAEATNFASG